MRFNLSSTALSSRLLTLSRVPASKNSLAILDCFRFGVHNNQLTITASDNENVMWNVLNLDECDGEATSASTARPFSTLCVSFRSSLCRSRSTSTR